MRIDLTNEQRETLARTLMNERGSTSIMVDHGMGLVTRSTVAVVRARGLASERMIRIDLDGVAR